MRLKVSYLSRVWWFHRSIWVMCQPIENPRSPSFEGRSSYKARPKCETDATLVAEILVSSPFRVVSSAIVVALLGSEGLYLLHLEH
jgi:hypothetical protein